MRELKIGRLPSNDIVLNEPTVSKYHAILRIEQTGVTLTDLNSTNGTFVNGNRLEDSIQLNELDIVKLGLILFDWNDYVGSNLEQKKASYQSYSEPDDLPQREIEEEKNEPIVVVYNYKYNETLKFKILSPTSFEIIESNYNHGVDYPIMNMEFISNRI